MDLLAGAKRFVGLTERLGGITPKTLSQRLRELEDGGIVAVDREPGRREVWYRLIPAGVAGSSPHSHSTTRSAPRTSSVKDQ